MKSFYTILLTLIITCTYTASAQIVAEKPKHEKLTKGPEYDKHYAKLKELHIKELNSESHKKSKELHKAFVKKLNYKGKYQDISKNVLDWVKENLYQTSFESYEAAEKEWKAVQVANFKSIKENQEYYDYSLTCLRYCDNDIIIQVMMDVMQEHPELICGEK
jgi:hypothetical protein